MTTILSRMIATTALTVALFSGTAVHAASSVLVWPVYQIIESDQNGSALWLENRGAEPVSLQVRVLAWGRRILTRSMPIRATWSPARLLPPCRRASAS